MSLPILLVEHDRTRMPLLAEALASLEPSIRRVADADGVREALCSETPPQVVLTNFSLPELDALEVIALRDGLRPDVPVIVITETGGEEIAVDCMRRGAADFIRDEQRWKLPGAVARAVERQRARARRVRVTPGGDEGMSGSHPDTASMYDTEARGGPVVIRYRTRDPRGCEYVSPRVIAVTGHAHTEFLGDPDLLPRLVAGPDRDHLLRLLAADPETEPRLETRFLTRKGTSVAVEIRTSPILDGDEQVVAVRAEIRETEAPADDEEAGRRHVALLRTARWASEHLLGDEDWSRPVPELLERLGQATGVSRVYLCQNTSDEQEELDAARVAEWSRTHGHADDPTPLHRYDRGGLAAWREQLSQGQIVSGPVARFGSLERVLLQADGIQSVALVPVFVRQHWWGILGLEDTERPLEWAAADLDVLRIVSDLLRTALGRTDPSTEAPRSDERYRDLLELLPDAVLVHDGDEVLKVNRAAADMLGAPRPSAAAGRKIRDILPRIHSRALLPPSHASTALEFGLEEDEFHRFDGTTIPVEFACIPIELGGVRAEQVIVRDLRQRREVEERVRRSQARISALRVVEQVVTDGVELRGTLDAILDQLTRQVGCDAAAILLLNPKTHDLHFSAGHGFHTDEMARCFVSIGEGLAGQVAHERRPVSRSDLAALGPISPRSEIFRAEGFKSYYGVPLIAKGTVRGVLEAFQRSTYYADPEWLDVFDTMASRAALAIEKAELFENLQHSTMELAHAYDATLEGWTRALDLRDRETEGHTKRVTEMTLKLAEALGDRSLDLVHLRRGALLHDIGKMGIPDSILLKAGPLTPHEWATMKLHPIYAHQMLYPIQYLRPAIDIPYCHHERWDGAGYPRGLGDTEIPLAARVFAVADVWDALRSNRPYRTAWTEERALAHIREGAGSQFDPEVVEAFLDARVWV